MQRQAPEIIRDYERSVARAILFCVSTSPLSLGIHKTIGILRGSKSTFVIEHNLFELPVYGMFSTFTTEYLRTVIEVLLEQELLAIEMVSQFENLPTLKVAPRGQDFLAGQLVIDTPFVDKLSDREVILLNDEEQELFEALRLLRRRLSDEKGFPAYAICHDAVLREMSKLKPTTPDKLLAIRGIGEKFVQSYGSAFLGVIRPFAH